MDSKRVPEFVGDDAATFTWGLLEERVEMFVRAWDESPGPPALAAYVPAEGPARRLVLVELVKVDLEYRWLRGVQARRLEEYAREFPELRDPEMPCDLIYEELHLRRRAGDLVGAEECRERFGEQATAVSRLLDAGGGSTLLTRGRRLTMVEVGERLDDFDLLVDLGRGAFARVFLARQRSMQRLVALKISEDKGDEPRSLAQMDHPNVLRVYDQRLLPERGLRLLYVQYVPGGTLENVLALMPTVPVAERSGQLLLRAVDDALDRRGEAPPEDSALRKQLGRLDWPSTVCWIGTRLTAALEHAHRRGVLPRDVKPANVLLMAEAQPKLADFNVGFCSKVEGATPGAFFGGSLGYMSPEQLEAFNPRHERSPASLDGRSDQYSLGVLLWELLAGERPWGETPPHEKWQDLIERLTAERSQGVPEAEWQKLRNFAPEELRTILERALQPRAEDRYGSCAEMGSALERCLHPELQRLFQSAASGWRSWVIQWPTLACLAAATIPNACAGFFNFVYNQREIVAILRQEGTAGAESIFWNVQAVINLIAFPLGMLLIAWWARPLALALRSPASEAAPLLARRRALRMEEFVAWLGVAEWLSAGIAYPIAMHLAIGGLPLDAYGHFLASLAVCGLVAAAYPFFLIATCALSAWYPTLLQRGQRPSQDVADLERLRGLAWLLLAFAAAIPMLGIVLLVLSGSDNRGAVIVLSLAGLLGCAMAVVLTRRVHRDVGALLLWLRPAEAASDVADDFTSSWTKPPLVEK